jgi:hypothetical protein
MLTSTFQDLRYALRALLKHRNFTAAALSTLALGIGINTSILTLLHFIPICVICDEMFDQPTLRAMQSSDRLKRRVVPEGSWPIAQTLPTERPHKQEL